MQSSCSGSITLSFYFFMLAFTASCLFTCYAAPTEPSNDDDFSQKGISTNHGNDEGNDNVCYTDECRKTAETLLYNMDPNADPCHDFYQYACNGFINKTVIPDDVPAVNFLRDTTDTMYLQLKETLEDNHYIASSGLRTFELTRTLYNQCMNTTAAEDNGLTPLHKVLKKFGGWPVIDGDSWNNQNTFDWLKMYHNLHKAGHLDYLFSFWVVQDPKNNSRRYIEFDHQTFGISEIYLAKGFNDSMVKAYHKFLVRSAVLLGADEEFATRELRESLKFEIELAKSYIASEQYRNYTARYNPTDLPKLKVQYPNLRWDEYFEKFLPPGIVISENETINVDVPSHLFDLNKRLSNISDRVIANYLLSRVVADASSYMNAEMRQVEFDWRSQTDGSTSRPPRWHECIFLLSKKLPIGLSAMYVRRNFNKDVKKQLVEMIADFKASFHKIIESANWIEENTRQRALKKVDSVSSHVAYPDELFDNAKVEEIYKDLQFTDSYVENQFRANIYQRNRVYSLLREPVVKYHWTYYASVTNSDAYYDPQENAFELPAAILQTQLFDYKRPSYYNYGRLGFIVGHLITLGFNIDAIQVDENGIMNNWWDDSSTEKYLERSQCLINQYNNYTVDQVGQKLNGEVTRLSNEADNGGVRVALNAYNLRVAKYGEEKKLPGIKLTPRQLFWLALASSTCTKYKDEFLMDKLRTDSHSPPEFRVNGPFSNMPEFSDAFGCSAESRMNRKDKCVLW